MSYNEKMIHSYTIVESYFTGPEAYTIWGTFFKKKTKL